MRPVYDLRDRHELHHGRERDGVGDLGRVIVEAPKFVFDGGACELIRLGRSAHRQEKAVSAAPPCDHIQLTSLDFCEVPLKITLKIERAVSAPNSICASSIPAVVGCVYTVPMARTAAPPASH
jgi:hypothetical protein